MPAVTHESITIRGELIEWRARTPDGWGTGALRGHDGGAPVPVTGKLFARVGDTVELVGTWSEHERWGKQFRVKQCTVARPESSDGIVAWLTSTLPDIGPSRARALVEHFGAELWNVIEQSPQSLTAVAGITPARIDAICRAYDAHRAERDHMIQLRAWGLTDNQIARCREVWGSIENVVERVHANPYELCRHVHGFGFKRADEVAARAGVARDAPERISAGLEYALDEGASTRGDCFLWGATLEREAIKLLGVDGKALGAGLRLSVDAGRIARRGKRYYPTRLDAAEHDTASRFARMIERLQHAEVIDLGEWRQQQQG